MCFVCFCFILHSCRSIVSAVGGPIWYLLNSGDVCCQKLTLVMTEVTAAYCQICERVGQLPTNCYQLYDAVVKNHFSDLQFSHMAF